MIGSRNKEKSFVVILFFLTLAFHCLLVMQDKVLMIYPDELAYLDPARSFIRTGEFAIHNINENWEPILYSILLAPYTLIRNSHVQIKVLYIINCLLMASSVFPTYILCKKIISKKTNRMLAMTIVALFPEFAMTHYFMAENLFLPLSLWLFVAVYGYLEETDKTKKRYRVVGLAVLCFLLYITKSIALGYCVGIAAVLAYDTVFERKWANLKENIINIIIFSAVTLTFIILFKYYITVTADVLGTIYDTRGELPLRNFKEILFLFFCIISYIVYTLVAFFFLPIVLPGAKFNSLKSTDRQFYIFSTTALFAMCCAVAIICNIREDALEESIRIHMRFYAPLFIPFILLTLSFSKIDFSKLQKKIYWVISCTSIFLMLIALRTPKFGCNLDAWLLFPYKSILYKICEKFHVNSTHGWPVILSMFIVVGIVLIVTFLGTKFGHDIKRIAIVILFFIIAENIYIMMIEYENNERFQAGIEDCVLLNKYFSDVEGNILVVSKEGSGYVTENVLDTYLSKEHFTVGYNDLSDLLDGNDGVWDISKASIRAHYPWHNYYNLEQVDYIIFNSENSIKLDKSNLEPVVIEGVEKFVVYKNFAPNYIYKDITKLESETLSIDFSDDGDAADYIVSGWHGQEEEAVWTTQEALIQYDAFIDSDFEIEIKCGTFIDTPEITFFVDDIEVLSDNVTRTEDGYKIYIDEYGYNPDSIKHSILFRDLNAASPAQMWDGNTDERILSLYVSEILIYDK